MKQITNLELAALSYFLPEEIKKEIIYINDFNESILLEAIKYVIKNKDLSNLKNNSFRNLNNFFKNENSKSNEIWSFEQQILNFNTNSVTSDLTLKTNNFNEYNITNEFIEQFKNLIKLNELNNLLSLIQYYFSFTNCGIKGLEHISIYTITKTTLAYLSCIEFFFNLNNRLPNLDEPVILQVNGGISGIQNYIYTISSKGAAKSLKGRSYFLQLVLNETLDMYKKEFNLSNANIIISSGGNFVLFIPYNETNKAKNNGLIKKIEEIFYTNFKTNLYLIICDNPISKNNILNTPYQNIYNKIEEKILKIKNNKFKNKLNILCKPTAVDNIEIDTITSEEIFENKDKVLFNNALNIKIDTPDFESNKNKFVSFITEQQIKIGKYIVNTSWIIKSYSLIANLYEYGCTFNNSQYYYFIDNWKKIDENINNLNNTCLIAINGLNKDKLILINSYLSKGENRCFEIELLGGNKRPYSIEENAIKGFDDLAGGDQISFKRLGVLRMDVDNLGNCFKKLNNIVFHSQLSYNLDLFFKGYINVLQQNFDKFKENIFIVYAGGDDLFIVGKWDITINFAYLIQQNFIKFINNNMSITGGMAMVTAKFPIQKAAELAGNFEKIAKEHSVENIKKNSFNFLEFPLKWNSKEFELVQNLKNEIKEFLKKGLDMSYIEKISNINYVRKYDKNKVKWIWMLVYDTARNYSSKNQHLTNFINNKKNEIINDIGNFNNTIQNYKFIDLYELACKWAFYENKS